MKNFIQFLALIFLLLVVPSCGGDDGDCTAETWAGQWMGSSTCEDVPIDFIFNITAVDEDTIRITYEGESEDLDVNGCNVGYDISLDFLGTAIDLDFDMSLNGDQIDLNFTFSGLGVTESCTTTLNR